MSLVFLTSPRKRTFHYNIKNEQNVELVENQILSEAELLGIIHVSHRY